MKPWLDRILNLWCKYSRNLVWDISYGPGYAPNEAQNSYNNTEETLHRLESQLEEVLSVALDAKTKLEELQEETKRFCASGVATPKLEELLSASTNIPFDSLGVFLPYSTKMKGETYHLYRVTFGKGNSFSIYAATTEHALQRVSLIRDSAELDGPVDAIN